MKTNIKTITKCPNFKKEVISFDKKGKKVITVKEITDCYLVILKNGSSIAMTKAQMKEYGIIGTLPDTKETVVSNKPVLVDEIEEDLDDTETSEENEETGQPNNSQVKINNSSIIIK